jgi:hypothetical protein
VNEPISARGQLKNPLWKKKKKSATNIWPKILEEYRFVGTVARGTAFKILGALKGDSASARESRVLCLRP